MEEKATRKLTEQELEGASGGLTQNRYNKDTCKDRTRTKRHDCWGQFGFFPCDHYSRTDTGRIGYGRPGYLIDVEYSIYVFRCAMNGYPPYEGYWDGDPIREMWFK